MATQESKDIVKRERREPMKALSPFNEFERRFFEMERKFEELFRRPFSMLSPSWRTGPIMAETGTVTPMADVFEEGDDIIIKAELPGISKEDVSVDFSNGMVTISGEKKIEEKVEKHGYHMMERSYGSFSRSISMPAEVDIEKAKAKFKDGVLEIRVPKTEESRQKMKKITIE